MVNYTLVPLFRQLNQTMFAVRTASGEIYTTGYLDYEHQNYYEYTVTATDRGKYNFSCITYTVNGRILYQNLTCFLIHCNDSNLKLLNEQFILGGLSTRSIIQIYLNDLNDNRPVFLPAQYNLSLFETALAAVTNPERAATAITQIKTSTLASPETENLGESMLQGALAGPLLIIRATDADAGRNGAITYRISAGNEAGLFRLDKNSGELLINRPVSLLSAASRLFSSLDPTHKVHVLNITASDGGGLRSTQDALIRIHIVHPTEMITPIFESSRYRFHIKEEVSRGAVIGTVIAQWTKQKISVDATGNLPWSALYH